MLYTKEEIRPLESDREKEPHHGKVD